MRRRVRDEEAVSPVIATVLLLAITVLLTSMVFIMFQGALSVTEKTPPQASTSVKGLENGFHVVRLSSLDQALDPASVRFTLYNASSGLEDQGYLTDNDVYGVVGAPVSFHDRDAGYSVTQGDYLGFPLKTSAQARAAGGFSCSTNKAACCCLMSSFRDCLLIIHRCRTSPPVRTWPACVACALRNRRRCAPSRCFSRPLGVQ